MIKASWVNASDPTRRRCRLYSTAPGEEGPTAELLQWLGEHGLGRSMLRRGDDGWVHVALYGRLLRHSPPVAEGVSHAQAIQDRDAWINPLQPSAPRPGYNPPPTPRIEPPEVAPPAPPPAAQHARDRAALILLLGEITGRWGRKLPELEAYIIERLTALGIYEATRVNPTEPH